jgi:hypothetical protein
MSSKTKTIQLFPGYYKEGESRSDPLGYRVGTVTDSLEYSPGDIISKREAEGLCASRDWKVTVKPLNT